MTLSNALRSVGNCERERETTMIQFVISLRFRPEKPDELFDNDETNQKDDDNEIDMNKIDEDMFNKVC